MFGYHQPLEVTVVGSLEASDCLGTLKRSAGTCPDTCGSHIAENSAAAHSVRMVDRYGAAWFGTVASWDGVFGGGCVMAGSVIDPMREKVEALGSGGQE